MTERVPRLSRATLDSVNRSSLVSGPPSWSADVSVGIVHFGVGAFHRAHQAVYSEDAMAATGQRNWGILGVTGRTDAAVTQLQPQDGLFTVITRSTRGDTARIVGSLRAVHWPGDDSAEIADMLASPAVHLATLTITEKGYRLTSAGTVDFSLPEVRADVSVICRELTDGSPCTEPSLTPLGLLVRGLARRYRNGARPFTVLPCDNIPQNGAVTRAAVRELAAAVARSTAVDVSGFSTWLERGVAFPSSVVDRLVPAATPRDLAEGEKLLGLRDEGLVVAEEYSQWVIEDAFAGPRPEWERVGAILTDDIRPYEHAKLRVLNAAHSMFAYLGALAGYATIAEAVADTFLRERVNEALTVDVLPTLTAPRGLDLPTYRDVVLDRFGNPALAHTTRQVASDGSLKVPLRIISTVRSRLASGHVPQGLALALAAWIAFVAESMRDGAPPLDDPQAEMLHAAVRDPDAPECDPERLVDRVFALRSIVPADVAEHTEFRDAVVAKLADVAAIVAAPLA
ncbi:mannitol dehydrogenase family protein [Microbacterium sp. MPKO10]|uniref:mannitol dehydrogenase family protein n=1 Tax=Microbacterium sp. MPKO10 TaxID=2989818 RepID=UPI00223613FB|nr:mannitol dehydrogenase family protein [Microbacterium sp. MPKO10]MCW4459130.1 mannitol dehydrogenase family protein [Microbacterium sp. MPKO10]